MNPFPPLPQSRRRGVWGGSRRILLSVLYAVRKVVQCAVYDLEIVYSFSLFHFFFLYWFSLRYCLVPAVVTLSLGQFHVSLSCFRVSIARLPVAWLWGVVYVALSDLLKNRSASHSYIVAVAASLYAFSLP